MKANQHFYNHMQAKRPSQIQQGDLWEHCKLPQQGPGQSTGR